MNELVVDVIVNVSTMSKSAKEERHTKWKGSCLKESREFIMYGYNLYR